MKPIEWVDILLKRHGLNKPDGRPLYQYRITDAEFDELKKIIGTSSHLGFESISRYLPLWDAAMVAYASEWWRRFYSGKWGWEGIFKSVGLNQAEFSTLARNQTVEIGLRRWQREVREVGGRRQFLGTVATEGGLPLKQLAEGGGWLQSLLRPVVKKHLEQGFAVDALIDSYIDVIPKSYRSSKELRQVLEDMVHTVCELRQVHNLDRQDRPIRWLDSNDPDWREKFPLPIDDDAGRSLLSELVTAAAKTNRLSDETVDTIFRLERFIKLPESSPKLVASLALPEIIPLTFFSKIDQSSLPGRITLDVIRDDGNSYPWCYGIQTVLRGEKVFKLSGRTWQVDDGAAMHGYSVRAKHEGIVLNDFAVMSAESLDADSPWMFKIVNNRYEYSGSQSQNLADEKGVFYLQEGFDIEALNEQTEFERKTAFQGGALYILTGQVSCARDQEEYLLKTGARDSQFSYEFLGKRYDDFSRPNELFIGLPEVRKRNNISGIVRRLDTECAVARPVGGNGPWKPVTQVEEGVYEIRLLENGVILWRKRIAILNSNFSITLKPDRTNPLNGEVILNGYGENHSLEVELDDARVKVANNASNSTVSLQASSSVPPYVDVNLLAESSNREIRLKLPYPSSGALLYAGDGSLLEKSDHTRLHLENLYGYRLRVFDDSFTPGKTANIRFSLIDNSVVGEQLKDIYIEKSISLTGAISEIALIDWQPLMQSMLGVSQGLDSKVQMSFLLSAEERVRLQFSRYENSLVAEYDNDLVRLSQKSLAEISVDKLNGIQLKGLRLNQPEQNSVTLKREMSGLVSRGSWSFESGRREAGNWMIYPDPNSSVQFRPLLWIVGDPLFDTDNGDIETINSLPKATYLSDSSLRELAVKKVLGMMANDLEHKSWGYLANLVDKTEHLPLAAFDVWRVCVSEPKFLAALIVQTGFENLVARLQSELPIIWELVHLKDWISVVESVRTKVISSLSVDGASLDDSEAALVVSIINKKIDAINDLSVSMNSLALVLRKTILGEESPELSAMSLPVDMILTGALNECKNELFQRQADNQWPEMLSASIDEFYESLPSDLHGLVSSPSKFRRPVLLLPILLAWRMNVSAYYGWLGNTGNIFKVDQLKAFDEDWFNTVFNYASGWISQHIQELK